MKNLIDLIVSFLSKKFEFDQKELKQLHFKSGKLTKITAPKIYIKTESFGSSTLPLL